MTTLWYNFKNEKCSQFAKGWSIMKKEYNTEPKKLINDFLKQNSDRHFTVDEIAEAVSVGEKSAGKSTVYRHVSKLLESGSVRRFETPGVKSFVYQYADVTDLCDDHYHLKCIKCGRLIHLECAKMDEVKKHILSDHDFIIGFDRAVLFGQCASCVAKG